jgi:ribosomal protein L4
MKKITNMIETLKQVQKNLSKHNAALSNIQIQEVKTAIAVYAILAIDSIEMQKEAANIVNEWSKMEELVNKIV